MEEDKKEIETLEVTGSMDPIVEKKEEPANPEVKEEKIESLIEPEEAPKEESKELPVDPEVVSDEVVLGSGDETKVEPEESVVAPPVIVETEEPTAPAAEPVVEEAPKVEEPTTVSEAPTKEETVTPEEPKEETPAVEAPKEEVKEEKPKKKSKLGLILFLLILLAAGGFAVWYFVLGGNGNKSGKEEPEKKTEVTKKEEKKSSYRLSGNGFEDFDLAFLSLESRKENRIYSPLSIKYMLAMLNEGTEGDAYEEIKAVIGDYVGKKYTNGSNMSLANALFIKDTFKDVKDTYKKTLQDKYGAEIIFDSFTSVSNINKWIEDKTLGLLKDAVNDGDLDSIIFWIVNALGIDMEWDVSFDDHPVGYSALISYNTMAFGWQADGRPLPDKFDGVDDVATMDFAASFNNYDLVKTVGEENYKKKLTEYFVTCLNENDKTKTYTESDVQDNVNTVIKNVNSNYGREDKSTEFMLYTDDNVKVFAKNLKEYNGTTLQYVAFMPTSGELSEFVEKTNSAKLTEYINELKTLKKENFKSGVITKIIGSVPRFKYDDSLDLMKDLKALGINEVFTPGKANLSKITNDKEIYIGAVLHKANIEFTEKGIKASAVTLGGGAGNLAAPCTYIEKDFPVEEIDMTFDKPYLYVIRDKDTGEIWFTGTVYTPQLYSDLNVH